MTFDASDQNGFPPEPPEPENEAVNHPQHYGGKDDPYEHVKVMEAWGMTNDAFLYNATKYIKRAGKKRRRGQRAQAAAIEDLKKSIWYLNRKIKQLGGEA